MSSLHPPNAKKILADTNIQRDRDLFVRIANGEGKAFRILFDLYYAQLRINAFRMLHNEFWAEEVAQEVLAKVWAKRDELPLIDHPAGWLFRVSANESLGLIRRQSRDPLYQYFLQVVQQHEIHPNYDADLLQKLVMQAVELLPKQQQLSYKMKQEQELSYKEIADQMGISANTVRNHLIQAYQFIRKFIQEHGEFFPILIYILSVLF